ncbi:MAG: hypothetical protein NC822_06870 [Candidatus Omnitrophica bacterium]|nr:hypothetical protein [Candidatus Omnitrophota bacterium]MCM8826960.1 hypothetical protein [Candidatus Omnitrophota bacterium]
MGLKDKEKKRLLGEILIDRGIINSNQLQEALEVQKKEGGLLGDILVKLGLAKEEDIAQAIAIEYGLPYLPLDNYEIPREVVKFTSKEFAMKYCLIPIDKVGNILSVAIANPLESSVIEELKKLTQLDIQIFISTASQIRRMINVCY